MLKISKALGAVQAQNYHKLEYLWRGAGQL